MFGIEEIVGTLRRVLGSRTDAADAAGSLHAKVKYINDTKIPTTETNLTNTINTRQAPRRGYPVAAGSTTSNSYVSLLSSTGKGRLIRLQGKVASSGPTCGIKVIIDGTTIIEVSPSIYTSWTEITALGIGDTNQAFDMCFNQSLNIQAYTLGAAVYAQWVYEKE